MKKKQLSLILLVLVFLIPNQAEAHIRWFFEKDATFPQQHYVMDTTSWLVIAGGLLFAVVSFFIHRSCQSLGIRQKLVAATPAMEPKLWRLVAILSGLMLIINTWMKIYLAPNLSLSGQGVIWFGLIAQMIIGLLLLFQVSFSISGFLIYVAAVLAIIFNPISLVIDYLFEFAALALSLILIGPSLSKIDRWFMNTVKLNVDKRRYLALPVIRVGVGLSLVVLSIHNKLLDPSMSVAFLGEYSLNFMPALGFTNFSDLHYSLSAGVAELVIGLLVLFGVATRFVVIVLTIFFFSTLIVLPMPKTELIGHLPLFGIAILLLLCGGGSFRQAAGK